MNAVVHAYRVTGPFFDLFGIPLLSGRTFAAASSPDEVDPRRAARQAALARAAAPSAGRSRSRGGPRRSASSASSARSGARRSIRCSTSPRCISRCSSSGRGASRRPAFGSGQIFVALRCGASCPGVDAITRAIRELSAQAMVVRMGPMEAEYLKDLARPRAAAALAAIFAAVALLASAGGLFGVLNAAVARRRREFGIRVALGIEPARLTRLVLADAARLAALGLCVRHRRRVGARPRPRVADLRRVARGSDHVGGGGRKPRDGGSARRVETFETRCARIAVGVAAGGVGS